jgi:uncharacterized protein YneF (UPF0154 family)
MIWNLITLLSIPAGLIFGFYLADRDYKKMKREALEEKLSSEG